MSRERQLIMGAEGAGFSSFRTFSLEMNLIPFYAISTKT